MAGAAEGGLGERGTADADVTVIRDDDVDGESQSTSGLSSSSNSLTDVWRVIGPCAWRVGGVTEQAQACSWLGDCILDDCSMAWTGFNIKCPCLNFLAL